MYQYSLRLLLLLLIMVISLLTKAQAPPRLIIRGDDMGFSHSGNLALVKTYREGITQSIEVIVPSPWFPEAVKMLEANPGVDVGIHLALSSEWDNIKWRPLTSSKSISDSDGYFYPMIYRNANYPGQSLSENKWKIEEIEKEFRAQIELALKKIPRVSHLSSHMGCTELSKEISALTKKLAKEYKIDIDLQDYQVIYTGYDGAHTTVAEKEKSFSSMLNKLEPGKTYLFLEHPGLNDAELQAIHHIGYENVAADRQGVTDIWTDPTIKELIRKKGIQLISYKDLKK